MNLKISCVFLCSMTAGVFTGCSSQSLDQRTIALPDGGGHLTYVVAKSSDLGGIDMKNVALIQTIPGQAPVLVANNGANSPGLIKWVSPGILTVAAGETIRGHYNAEAAANLRPDNYNSSYSVQQSGAGGGGVSMGTGAVTGGTANSSNSNSSTNKVKGGETTANGGTGNGGVGNGGQATASPTANGGQSFANQTANGGEGGKGGSSASDSHSAGGQGGTGNGGQGGTGNGGRADGGNSHAQANGGDSSSSSDSAAAAAAAAAASKSESQKRDDGSWH